METGKPCLGDPRTACARLLALDAGESARITAPTPTAARVVNKLGDRAVSGEGVLYAPDPSSQVVCSIGATWLRTRGVHCLKYASPGNTCSELEWSCLWPDPPGWAVRGEMPGLDLRGVFSQPEGTLGIATAIHPCGCCPNRRTVKCCWPISVPMEPP